MTLFAALGCSAPGGPEGAQPWATQQTGGQNTDGGVVPDALPVHLSGTCKPPHASESLTPRVTAMGMVPMKMVVPGGAPQQVIKTSDVFNRLNASCGACHVAAANGGKQTSAATFTTTVDITWVASITSDDPSKAMPPENKAYSSRPANDPIRTLVSLLQAWIAAGRPSEVFAVDDPSMASPDNSQTIADYSFTADMAVAMSNLGTCIPDKAAYASSPSNEMDSKDTFFASATKLPDSLGDTDLVTFDSSVLAANGVIAYAPTYPLWSNGSGKLRHIRVPKGTSVKFDKVAQTFDLPPNTRFYKTFFRKVKDIAGRESHLKIETRLIVARPDTIAADGSIQQNALFGTYLWNPDETEATLNTATYRDGTAFPDELLKYVTDELEYERVVASLPAGSATSFEDRLATALNDAQDATVVQHYAVPGRVRCVQCHQGSPTKDFVLGFFPLQVARQPDGRAGTYEPTGADELTQLQRMIDYGLITGMDSPADVIGLEQSQAPRHARTHEELAAQAYMVGNCAHCHNPRGYPSIAKPELAAVLNFMPGHGLDGGGIFEFPLTKVSPIRLRGSDRDVPIPYITPSLRDYPVMNDGLARLDSGAPLGDSGNEVTYSPKYLPGGGGGVASCPGAGRVWCGDRKTGLSFVDAPWRSLIYRNVDTPFLYYDDYVPFPHMPLNTAGYDYRAPRLMGDWMVSIPAVRVDQNPEQGHGEDDLPSTKKAHDGSYDDSPQPYVEVKPGDPAYSKALDDAKARLAAYHAGIRYNYREEVLGTDVVDEILFGFNEHPAPSDPYRPDPKRYLWGGIAPSPRVGLASTANGPVFPSIGVPYHSHWFNYDPTDNSTNWQPRRGTAWRGVLVDGVADTTPQLGLLPDAQKMWVEQNLPERIQTTVALGKAQLTDDLRRYATTPVPYGLWKVKPQCQAKLAGMPKVADFSGANGPWWITTPDPAAVPVPDAPVYMAKPGQMLYRHICFNCHGPRADGKGIQADALAAASDGDARPANFVAGLFGPVDHPGDNLTRVFGAGLGNLDPAQTLNSAEKLAARYMAWMALGGTLQNIPVDVIHQIEATRILGIQRPHLAELGAPSGNMLNLAKNLCSKVLFETAIDYQFENGIAPPKAGYPLFASNKRPFVHSNGDYEMWLRLCSEFNRPVVRVYSIVSGGGTSDNMSWNVALHDPARTDLSPSLFYGETYPAAKEVWDQDQRIQMGIHLKGNFFPACFDGRVLDEKSTAKDVIAMQGTARQFLDRWKMPVCPLDFLANATPLSTTDATTWTLQGAIATGMAVFSYLRDPTTDFVHQDPPPYYDECQLLP